MIRYENDCVCCPPELGCLGTSCPKRNVPVTVCDDCQDEGINIYEFEGEQLCIYCIEKRLKKVET